MLYVPVLRSHVALRGLWFVGLTWAGAAVCLGQMQAGVHWPVEIESPRPYPGHPGGTEPVSAWSYELHDPGATYIAIHFRDFALAPGDYLALSDPGGGQYYQLAGRGKLDAGTFWAPHIKGDTAVLKLVVTGPSGGPGFDIDEYVAGFVDLGGPRAEVDKGKDGRLPSAPRGTEAICGLDDKQNAACYRDLYPELYEHGRPVARLLIQGSTLCTGWLASPFDHLITNQHCIATSATALNTDFEFMAEAPDCETPNCQLCHPGQVFSGGVLIQSDAGKDYSLVRIAGNGAAASYGYLRMTEREPVVGEQIYIPQHPSGRAKEIAMESTNLEDSGGVCRVFSLDEPPCTGGSGEYDVGYYADTEGGSSGSPVIAAADHQVVALHHCADCPNRGVAMSRICPELPGNLCRPSAGAFWMVKPIYACDDVVTIALWDEDLGGEGTVEVEVTTLGGDAEVVVLAESPIGSGAFTADLLLLAGSPVQGNGLLEAQVGDEALTLWYDDADNGTGKPAWVIEQAAVDCRAPVISDVTVPILHAVAATIAFETDEPTTSDVLIGCECESLVAASTQAAPGTVHRHLLRGLQPETTYFFAVRADDAAHNSSYDDNQGQCYSFTTTALPSDYFTERFNDSHVNDLSYHSVMLVPEPSVNWYGACSREVTSLPTDPEGGIEISLADDGYALVTLDAGRMVKLYGESYPSFYVGSNGYVTFGAGDWAYLESPSLHFSLPHISGLFDDLNPNSRGEVSWKQLEDRVAVTWWEVPKYAQIDGNTFQIEMFFDGRIRLSWLELASPDGLAGLSAGLGVPVNFAAGSDLTAYDCPAPPTIEQARSLKQHGADAEYGVDLHTREGICDVAVEGRSQGLTRLTVLFDQAIVQTTGTAEDVWLSAGTVTSLDVQDSSLTVEIAGCPAAGRLGVAFPGITGVFDHVVEGELCIGVLTGDTNQDCHVNVFDLVSVRTQLNQRLDAANFAQDVSVDGQINIFDLVMVRNLLGGSILGLPCPSGTGGSAGVPTQGH